MFNKLAGMAEGFVEAGKKHAQKAGGKVIGVAAHYSPQATTAIINRQIKEYGTMIDFKFDKNAKKISMRLDLKGESQPLSINVNDFEMIKKEDETFIKINSVDFDREWLSVLAEKYVKGKEFKLPEDVVFILEGVLSS